MCLLSCFTFYPTHLPIDLEVRREELVPFIPDCPGGGFLMEEVLANSCSIVAHKVSTFFPFKPEWVGVKRIMSPHMKVEGGCTMKTTINMHNPNQEKPSTLHDDCNGVKFLWLTIVEWIGALKHCEVGGWGGGLARLHLGWD